MASLKKIGSIIMRISISVALLIFLFRKVDEKALFKLIKDSDKPFLFYGFASYFLIYPLAFFRWNMLLKAAKIHPPKKKVVASYAGGIFFNLFLPSTIGGDFMRSMNLAKHTKKTKEIVATVFLDRLSGYIGLVFIAAIAVVLGYRMVEDKVVFLSVGFLVLFLGVILVILFNNRIYLKINKFLNIPRKNSEKLGVSTLSRIGETLSSLHREIYYFRHKKKIIFYNLFLSLLLQLISPFSFYLLGLALGLNIHSGYFFVYLPIVAAITLLPISIGGLGLRDASTVYFFAKAGVSKDLSFAMSLLNFSFILIFGCIGGVIYALTLRNRRL